MAVFTAALLLYANAQAELWLQVLQVVLMHSQAVPLLSLAFENHL